MSKPITKEPEEEVVVWDWMLRQTLLRSPAFTAHFEALTFYRQARAHRVLGEYAAAVTDYTKAITVQKSIVIERPHPPIMRGEYSSPLRQIRLQCESKNVSPVCARFHFHRGLAYDVQGEWSLALADFEIALASEPQNHLYALHRSQAWSCLERHMLALPRGIPAVRGGVNGFMRDWKVAESIQPLLFDELSPLYGLPPLDPKVYVWTGLLMQRKPNAVLDAMLMDCDTHSIQVCACVCLVLLQDLNMLLMCALYFDERLVADSILHLPITCLSRVLSVVPLENGRTPLHIAASKSNVEDVKLLLDKSCDPNARDVYGRTAMHYAVMQDSGTLVRCYAHCRIAEYREGDTSSDARRRLRTGVRSCKPHTFLLLIVSKAAV